MDQRALPLEQRWQQASLLRANFIPAQRRVHHTIAEHHPFQFGFGPAILSLVAGRISRTHGSTTLGVGRSRYLRQPGLERFSLANAFTRVDAEGCQRAYCALRFKLD